MKIEEIVKLQTEGFIKMEKSQPAHRNYRNNEQKRQERESQA